MIENELAALLQLSTGASTFPNLSVADLRAFQVPWTDRRHQIASILSAYDDLIENNTRRIGILEEMARRLYEEWFVNFRFPGHEGVRMVQSELEEVPEGWGSSTVGEVTEFVGRGITPRYDDDAECRIVNQKCIRDQRLSLELARRQNKDVPDNKFVRTWDVLINSTGVGTLGRVAQVCEPLENCTVDSHVTIVRPRPGIDVDFFGLALMHMQPKFEDMGVGATGQTELSRSRVSETPFLSAPPDLQDQFGEAVRPMRSLCMSLARKNANLRAQRDLLLPKLISGEIDVSDFELPEEDAA